MEKRLTRRQKETGDKETVSVISKLNCSIFPGALRARETANWVLVMSSLSRVASE